MLLPFDAYAFFGDQDFFTYSRSVRFGQESFYGLFECLVAEREGSVMHGDEHFRAEVVKGPNCLFRIHVDVTTAG